jgi:hypothetical protein
MLLTKGAAQQFVRLCAKSICKSCSDKITYTVISVCKILKIQKTIFQLLNHLLHVPKGGGVDLSDNVPPTPKGGNDVQRT